MTVTLTRLPVLQIHNNNIIKGVLIKFADNQGGWTRHDGAPLRPNAPLLVLNTTRALQRWANHRPETIAQKPDEKLPDPAVLNEAIPQSEWEIGLDGKPQPP